MGNKICTGCFVLVFCGCLGSSTTDLMRCDETGKCPGSNFYCTAVTRACLSCSVVCTKTVRGAVQPDNSTACQDVCPDFLVYQRFEELPEEPVPPQNCNNLSGETNNEKPQTTMNTCDQNKSFDHKDMTNAFLGGFIAASTLLAITLYILLKLNLLKWCNLRLHMKKCPSCGHSLYDYTGSNLDVENEYDGNPEENLDSVKDELDTEQIPLTQISAAEDNNFRNKSETSLEDETLWSKNCIDWRQNSEEDAIVVTDDDSIPPNAQSSTEIISMRQPSIRNLRGARDDNRDRCSSAIVRSYKNCETNTQQPGAVVHPDSIDNIPARNHRSEKDLPSKSISLLSDVQGPLKSQNFYPKRSANVLQSASHMPKTDKTAVPTQHDEMAPQSPAASSFGYSEEASRQSHYKPAPPSLQKDEHISHELNNVAKGVAKGKTTMLHPSPSVQTHYEPTPPSVHKDEHISHQLNNVAKDNTKMTPQSPVSGRYGYSEEVSSPQRHYEPTLPSVHKDEHISHQSNNIAQGSGPYSTESKYPLQESANKEVSFPMPSDISKYAESDKGSVYSHVDPTLPST